MLLPLALLLAQTSSSNDLRRTYAAGDKDAVLMLPPETVSGSETRRFAWSADGAYLAASRYVDDRRFSEIKNLLSGAVPSGPVADPRHLDLVVWSADSHKLRTIFTMPSQGGLVEDIHAIPGSDRFLVLATQRVAQPNGDLRTVESFLLLNPGSGDLTTLASVEEPNQLGVDVSPTAPLGVLIGPGPAQGPKRVVRFFGPSGFVGPNVPVPEGGYFTFEPRRGPGILTVLREAGKLSRSFAPIDPTTGGIGAATVLPKPSPDAKSPEEPMSALFATVTLPKGFAAPTVMLSVAGGKPEEAGVVTTDGEQPALSPRLDAVAYVAQGSLLVRPLAKVPRKAYEQALLARAKSEALSKAKQVGLGLIMYAGDMDDVLPGQGGDLRSLIGPYLKNDDLFNGFSYTFKGGNMAGVDKPAETEMGYVSGPGGRAVVYVDGHAKWVPNP